MTIENITIDDDYSYAFEGGQVIIVYRNQVIALGSFQGSNAIIAAVAEIEELRNQIGNARMSPFYTHLVDRLGRVDVEDGKYTIHETHEGVSLLRHGGLWIQVRDLELPELWLAIGHQLQALREIARPRQSR